MAYVDWRISGPELTACNCDIGCPCQFNSLPTRGNCRAVVAMEINSGHFGTVKLDGLRWAGVFAWPKAIHEGNGEAQPIIDIRADASQREAILKILAGQETAPGATIFNVFATTLAKVHPPIFAQIDFAADFAKRTGRFAVANTLDAKLEPIRNPVTGAEHRARIVMPEGFEYHEAEIASGTVRATGAISHDWAGRHAHLTMLDMGPHGPKH